MNSWKESVKQKLCWTLNLNPPNRRYISCLLLACCVCIQDAAFRVNTVTPELTVNKWSLQNKEVKFSSVKIIISVEIGLLLLLWETSLRSLCLFCMLLSSEIGPILLRISTVATYHTPALAGIQLKRSKSLDKKSQAFLKIFFDSLTKRRSVLCISQR